MKFLKPRQTNRTKIEVSQHRSLPYTSGVIFLYLGKIEYLSLVGYDNLN